MIALLAFIGCMLFVLMASRRLPPFITLVIAAIAFALVTGVEDPMAVLTGGMGSIFALLGIAVFCGAVIAESMRSSGSLDRVVEDLSFGSPDVTGAVTGAVLAVPFMCCITDFIVASPIVSRLSDSKSPLYALAVGSVIGFVLLFPAPVMLVLAGETSSIDLVTIPLCVALLIGYVMLSKRSARVAVEGSGKGRLWSWAPILVPVCMMAAGALVGLDYRAVVNVSLLAGLLVALASLGAGPRTDAVKRGTRNAGMIMFDLCAAGALGAVIGASELPSELLSSLGGLPAVLAPFILATAIQAAQGSRVVTVTVVASMLAAPLGIAEILMVAAGAMMLSTLPDPYFWVISRATGDDPSVVLRRYSLPLTICGLCIAGFALAISAGTP